MTTTLLKDLYYETLEKVDNLSQDFISDYSLEGNHYLGDLFSEYADGAISVYCRDQHNFYIDNEDWCNQCLEEFYSNEDLGRLIKDKGVDGFIEHAGAVGWYEKNYHTLSSDSEEIQIALVIKYLINNFSEEQLSTISEDKLNDLLEQARDYRDDSLEGLRDLVMEVIQ